MNARKCHPERNANGVEESDQISRQARNDN